MKNPMTFILPIALLSGCSVFPEHGKGGMAEHYYTPVSGEKNAPLGPEDGLRFEWELSARHLDALVMNGAERCYPAAVVQMKRMQNRIIRELEGGLDFDAANDLIIQRTRLERLEKDLDARKESQDCALTSDKNAPSSRKLAQDVFTLLNADSQFAFNSSKINPKYMQRLADASHLLRDLPQFALHITGHADAIGDTETNQRLSLARAEQVKRYLLVFGLPTSRLSIGAVGSSDPLFDGNEAQIRLVNRRVSIELIETFQDKPLGLNEPTP